MHEATVLEDIGHLWRNCQAISMEFLSVLDDGGYRLVLEHGTFASIADIFADLLLNRLATLDACERGMFLLTKNSGVPQTQELLALKREDMIKRMQESGDAILDRIPQNNSATAVRFELFAIRHESTRQGELKMYFLEQEWPVPAHLQRLLHIG